MADTQTVQITIPDDVAFADLQLARDPVTLDVSFNWAPIERICAASGLDIALLREQHEDNVAGLIVAWYMEHRQHGGAIDQVEEQIIAEVEAEDLLGVYRVQSAPGTQQ